MDSIRWLIPSKPPPLKTFMMPMMMIGAMAPNMDNSGWAYTITLILLATWVGSLITEKVENSEWRQQLRKDAEAAHKLRNERELVKTEEKKEKVKKPASESGSRKKKE
mmetsp:Transcript_14394/g.37363  ORF Transcript_14394/g.37363 Transcript_14394/m.37363 type:complete len:108 (+) Transcript_14394:137-460(+)|eukprot:CAMPEP_0115875952 /NCGR_PEP_ID=MMETSP0287-20121206/25387_1 /TAXON_ID=412157 /ORGANISM="Chrysochromulina rotalis, Strain UIO044" /LENGTH=107 /DNA_ID=CAMNT_0003331281 /DNA_START=122 /DNA_END=445 /DNA_ORIENTATION=-